MSIIDNAKEVADLVKKIGDIELYRKIVALEGEVIDLTREKRALENRVGELERAIVFTKKLTFKEPFYFAEGDATPYCPACWEIKREAVHVIRLWSEGGETKWDCPVCKNGIKVATVRAGYQQF
jgi:hypothetical protein